MQYPRKQNENSLPQREREREGGGGEETDRLTERDTWTDTDRQGGGGDRERERERRVIQENDSFVLLFQHHLFLIFCVVLLSIFVTKTDIICTLKHVTNAFLIGLLHAVLSAPYLPGLREVLVVGVPDPGMGQEICACFVASDPSLSEEHVRRQVEKDILVGTEDPLSPLPRYYVSFQNFPRTFTGKPLRRGVQEAAARRLKLGWSLPTNFLPSRLRLGRLTKVVLPPLTLSIIERMINHKYSTLVHLQNIQHLHKQCCNWFTVTEICTHLAGNLYGLYCGEADVYFSFSCFGDVFICICCHVISFCI